MKRSNRRTRPRPVVEPLEGRRLLAGNGNVNGMYPLINSTPETTIFVRFTTTDPASDQARQLSALGASVVSRYPDGPDLIALGPGVSPSSAIARLSADPGVLYAAPDAMVHADALSSIPNDPALSQDWAVNNPNGVNIDLPKAWAATLGTRSTIVAVIDTGVDLGNPDFAGKIWTNPTDDSASGHPGDIHGFNFVDNTGNVQDDSTDGHGTHISAVIAAIGNNNYGIAGVDQNAQIMPLKFLDASGSGQISDAISAIYFAVDHGAQVINASWGGEPYSAPLRDAIAYAAANNVVFVTAAGNDGTDNDTIPSYPASYEASNEISVAAVGRAGNLPGYSNYGPGTVNLGAPGSDIVSEVPLGVSSTRLETLTGTSMATAYVSGVAALVSGANPGFSAAEVVRRIDSTVKPLASLQGKTISGGMVDAYNAVTDNGRVAVTNPPPPAGLPKLAFGRSTDAEVRASILASDEFLAVHGGTAAGFIDGIYRDVLDRTPDPGALAYWVGVYNSGAPTRFDIALDIVSSPEARLTEVAGWFRRDLGRTDSIASLKNQTAVAVFANLLLGGAGDNTVEATLMSFPEYLVNHGDNPAGIVRGFYQDIMDRPVDPFGLGYFGGLIASGNPPFAVLRAFQGTPEAKDTKVAGWFVEDLGRSRTIDQLKGDLGVEGWAADLGNY